MQTSVSLAKDPCKLEGFPRHLVLHFRKVRRLIRDKSKKKISQNQYWTICNVMGIWSPNMAVLSQQVKHTEHVHYWHVESVELFRHLKSWSQINTRSYISHRYSVNSQTGGFQTMECKSVKTLKSLFKPKTSLFKNTYLLTWFYKGLSFAVFTVLCIKTCVASYAIQ